MHTFTFENQLFFNKTYEPNFSLPVPPDLANQFFKFHANCEHTSLRAYRREKFALSNKVFLLAILLL